eukprot:gene19381-biopygen5499
MCTARANGRHKGGRVTECGQPEWRRSQWVHCRPVASPDGACGATFPLHLLAAPAVLHSLQGFACPPGINGTVRVRATSASAAVSPWEVLIVHLQGTGRLPYRQAPETRVRGATLLIDCARHSHHSL